MPERDKDTIARLEALRDDLREALDEAKRAGAGTVAQLSAQYRATLADLLALDPPAATGPLSKLDELKERRARRDTDQDRAPTPAPVRAARKAGGKRGA